MSKPARAELAVFLRELQESAELDNARIADRAGLHLDRVRRALNGQTVPADITVIEKIVGVCCERRPETETTRLLRKSRALWRQAQMEARGLRPTRKPEPELIGSFAELVTAMERLRMSMGNPSTRELEKKAGPGMLPHTSLDRVFSRDKLPTKLQVTGLAKAVSLTDTEIEQWGDAWTRADSEAKKAADRRQAELRKRSRQARGVDAVAAVVTGKVPPARPEAAMADQGLPLSRNRRFLQRALPIVGEMINILPYIEPLI